MTRNYALIEQVWQYIQDHPRQHRQNSWFSANSCGTTACFAGWATLLSGYKTVGVSLVRRPGGDRLYVSEVARDLLGLTFEEGKVLFAGSNGRPMMALMVKDLLNGADLQEPKFYRKLRKEQIAAERRMNE